MIKQLKEMCTWFYTSTKVDLKLKKKQLGSIKEDISQKQLKNKLKK